MQGEIQFELTDALVRRAVWRHCVTGRLSNIIGGVAFLALVLAGFFFELVPAPGLVGFLVVAILAVVWPPVAYLKALGDSTSLLRLLPHRRVSWQATDQGLAIDMPLVHADVPWEMFDELRRYRDAWLLHIHGCCWLPAPAALLNPGLADLIATKIREHGGKVV